MTLLYTTSHFIPFVDLILKSIHYFQSINSHYAVMEIPRKRSSSQRISDEESDNPTLEYQLLYTSHVKADISQSRYG